MNSIKCLFKYFWMLCLSMSFATSSVLVLVLWSSIRRNALFIHSQRGKIETSFQPRAIFEQIERDTRKRERQHSRTHRCTHTYTHTNEERIRDPALQGRWGAHMPFFFLSLSLSHIHKQMHTLHTHICGKKEGGGGRGGVRRHERDNTHPYIVANAHYTHN